MDFQFVDIEINGMQNPIDVSIDSKSIFYLFDGRNRVKAMKDLEYTKIKARIFKNLTDKDILSKVNSAENRRHQSQGCRAVTAWVYFQEQKKLGIKMTQQEAAQICGADHRLMSIVNKIHKSYKRDDIIAVLKEGKKINISNDDDMPFATDNLRSIERWLLKESIKLESVESISAVEPEVSLEEEKHIYEAIDYLKKHLKLPALKKANKELYSVIKNIENQ
jgi:hypothetical protein